MDGSSLWTGNIDWTSVEICLIIAILLYLNKI